MNHEGCDRMVAELQRDIARLAAERDQLLLRVAEFGAVTQVQWALRNPDGSVSAKRYGADRILGVAKLSPDTAPVSRAIGEWRLADDVVLREMAEAELRESFPIRSVLCGFCGTPFPLGGKTPSKKYCGTKCGQNAYHARQGRAKRYTDQARSAGYAIVEEVDPDVVFERDGGICYLCEQPVDKNADVCRGPAGPTMDHVIPVSKGGEHSYANIKLTHRGCNSRKAARIVDIIDFELRDRRVGSSDLTRADAVDIAAIQHGYAAFLVANPSSTITKEA